MIIGAETPVLSSLLSGTQQAARTSSNSAPSQVKSLQATDSVDVSTEETVVANAVKALTSAADAPEITDSIQTNIQQTIADFQERLSDESRIPPSIFKQIRELLEAADQENSGENLDRLA